MQVTVIPQCIYYGKIHRVDGVTLPS